MEELNVRIEHLQELRVASACGFGTEPEMQAWEKILGFVAAKKLAEGKLPLRYFGFNNPNPSPGSPNYGYEQWVTVGPELQGEGDVEIKDIPAARYAVTRFQGISQITETWKRLVAWVEGSSYRIGPGYCLEELLTSIDLPPEQWRFDLYLPLEE